MIVLPGGFDDGEMVKRVSYSGLSSLRHLVSTQEEEDTCLILHSINLANLFLCYCSMWWHRSYLCITHYRINGHIHSCHVCRSYNKMYWPSQIHPYKYHMWSFGKRCMWRSINLYALTGCDSAIWSKNIYPACVDMGPVCSSLDELRYIFACTTDKQASQFRPTKDAFEQHIWAEYQTTIHLWWHSYIAKPQLWNPVSNG